MQQLRWYLPIRSSSKLLASPICTCANLADACDKHTTAPVPGRAGGPAEPDQAAAAAPTKRQRRRAKADEEERVRAAELRQLSNPQPQSALDFERLVRSALSRVFQGFCVGSRSQGLIQCVLLL